MRTTSWSEKNLAIREAEQAEVGVRLDGLPRDAHATDLDSGYVYLLLEGASGDLLEEQRRFLAIVNENCGRLLVLITDLLDLSRMRAGRLQVDPGRCRSWRGDPRRGRCAPSAGRLEVTVARARPAGRSARPSGPDRDRVTQIVTNLVSNAHKYTPDVGHIWITARAVDEAVEIAVRDDGLGLSPEEQTRLFSRFFQVHERDRPALHEAGLGLAITQQLVTLHGGQIRVERARPGVDLQRHLPTAASDASRSAPSDDALKSAPRASAPRA